MSGRIAVAVVLALFFVWSLPGLTALRHLLMFAGLLLLTRRTNWHDAQAMAQANRWPLMLFGLLSLWLIVQALFVSPETAWALGELKGQWGNALLAGALGLLLAAAMREGRLAQGKSVTTAVVGVLILQAAIAVGQSVGYWFTHGELLEGVVPLTGGKLEMSYILNILLAALTVDLLFRACHRQGFLRLPMPVVVAALLLALLSDYLAGARNGTIGVLFLSISAITLYLIEIRHRHGGMRALGGATLLLAAVMSFAVLSYRSDARWQTFAATVPIAWDIDTHRTWLDSDHYPYPALPNGEPVEASAYLRVAWIHAGLRLIGEHPLGVGYGRNAFVHALRQTEEAKVGHAHSGWIDLGVGGGIPALLLWAGFLGSLLAAGAVRYFRRADPHALWLLLLTTGYAGRMMLDSVNRDHMLQIFLFLSFYLLAMSLPQAAETRPAPPPR